MTLHYYTSESWGHTFAALIPEASGERGALWLSQLSAMTKRSRFRCLRPGKEPST